MYNIRSCQEVETSLGGDSDAYPSRNSILARSFSFSRPGHSGGPFLLLLATVQKYINKNRHWMMLQWRRPNLAHIEANNELYP
jgi:hypothetical protein